MKKKIQITIWNRDENENYMLILTHLIDIFIRYIYSSTFNITWNMMFQ